MALPPPEQCSCEESGDGVFQRRPRCGGGECRVCGFQPPNLATWEAEGPWAVVVKAARASGGCWEGWRRKRWTAAVAEPEIGMRQRRGREAVSQRVGRDVSAAAGVAEDSGCSGGQQGA
ncbi:Os06g0243200 [Oryza sativa Japonica Group]|uniref:Os06g0243200 protein n=2 Tax=Oryza sativa subsp. japonica TaxID=39947 RepID=A3BA63_ORYSJ|nr:hypothetical protein OsJ_20783 [Oryza sativa Japonica Group]BAS97008.1 Os06g0243200 [Oryza sativa Japonica Group]